MTTPTILDYVMAALFAVLVGALVWWLDSRDAPPLTDEERDARLW